MKWQHWLGWALLAVCVMVLGVYVFWDKPAEAQEQKVVRQEVETKQCYAVVTSDHLGLGVDVPCPAWPSDQGAIRVLIYTSEGQWFGAIYKTQ